VLAGTRFQPVSNFFRLAERFVITDNAVLIKAPFFLKGDRIRTADSRDGAPTMTQFDGETVRLRFEIVEPAVWAGRRSFSILRIPARSTRTNSFNASADRPSPRCRRSEDSFMDELIGGP